MPGSTRATSPGRRRASGLTAGQEAADVAAEELTEPVEERVTPEERDRTFTHLSFARMRTEWGSPEDRQRMTEIRSIVDGRIKAEFEDAYGLLYELFKVIRQQRVDEETGELVFDYLGEPVWEQTVAGAWVEDWSLLTTRQREDFLFRITTQLFFWSQRAADIWGESMFSKAVWQERYAREYASGMSGTVDDLTSSATANSAEEKYFALFVSYLSRRADAVVRQMEALALRLKDTLPR